jgi:MFS family permease
MRDISNNIIWLGIVSFFTDVSSEMIFPLLPIFLTTVLGAGALAVGIIEGAADATASLLKVVSGWWSDRTGRRKPFTVAGYSISALIKPLFAFSTSWVHVLVARFTERTGKGIRDAPRDAIIAASSVKGTRGKAFGIHHTLDTAGAIVGPLVAVVLLSAAFGFREIFLIATIPAFIAVAVLVLFVKEVRGEKNKRSLLPSINALPREAKLFILAAGIFALGQFSWAFFILRTIDVGFTATSAMLFYLLFNIVHALFSTPLGMLSDKVGRRPVLIVGYLFFALVSIGFTQASPFLILLLFMLYGLCIAITDVVQRAYISDLVEPRLRGTAIGSLNTVVGVAALPASVLAGVLWSSFGATAAFVYGAALAAVAAMMLVCLRRR